MRARISKWIDWVEAKLNVWIDLIALMGALFMILLAVFITVSAMTQEVSFLDGIEFILIPGFIGFMAILMLFALRITRHLTKNKP